MQRGGNEISFGKKAEKPSVTPLSGRSLHDAAHTTNVLTEKRLLIDMASLRELIEKGELKMEWIGNENQLADVLTKQEKAGLDEIKDGINNKDWIV